ncbi:MAG: DNA mismatch endonuclease Vsr [Burkholderiales bacterium]|nr:DNA mismatch endonuclease Vsr [Phycisphaerae bacterium]
MADPFTKIERSRIMAAVKSKDTTPELVVRSIVHRLGHRFRLHVRSLPGTPDIVLSRHRKIIEVRGCFWHMHSCRRFRNPVTRKAWWREKFRRNVNRDKANLRRLRLAGWKVLVVWECETRSLERLKSRLNAFLEKS